MSLIKVDMLSIARESEGVVVRFFSYYDMFRTWKALGDTVTIRGIKVQVVPIENNLENWSSLYLSHAAGGSRNVMLSNLEDYMDGTFIREEAEKFGEIESVKHLRDKKVCYVEFFSFVSAIEFVCTIREDTLFENVKVIFGKDKLSDECNNNRTVYFGNVLCEVGELLESVIGGKVFAVKTIKEKKCAFITFYDQLSAVGLIEYANTTPIVVKGCHMKLGAGKPQQLPHIVPILAYKGVTRAFSVDPSLRHRLGDFGEIDKIEAKTNRLVVIYTNVLDAYAAREEFLRNPATAHLVYEYEEDPCNAIGPQKLLLMTQKYIFG